jgi:hypothetical protein
VECCPYAEKQSEDATEEDAGSAAYFRLTDKRICVDRTVVPRDHSTASEQHELSGGANDFNAEFTGGSIKGARDLILLGTDKVECVF